MDVRDTLYIDGRWVPGAGAGMIDVICGSTEDVMARIPEGGAADVDAAVPFDVGKRAGKSLSKTNVPAYSGLRVPLARALPGQR